MNIDSKEFVSGGIYAKLPNSEFRVLVTLTAYADEDGKVCDVAGRPYRKKLLVYMVRLNYRSVVKALDSLEHRGLIRIDNNIIYIKYK